MEQISNDLLIEAYNRAVKQDLNADFIGLFYIEINKRGLEEQIKTSNINESV